MLKMGRREFVKTAAIVAGALGSAGGLAAAAEAQEKEDLFAGVNRLEHPESPTALEKKHVPKIELLDKPEAGKWLRVQVSAGIGLEHPSANGHYIQWIELYVGERPVGRADLVPTISKGFLTAVVRLPKGKHTLRARLFCNLHGLWEGTKEVEVA